jgi:hypothetical protein
MGAFGFTGAYLLVSLAAPAFLKKRGEMQMKHVALCVVTVILLLVFPVVGSVYPVPAPPVNAFPYVFGIYLFMGYIRVMSMQHQKPVRVEEIGKEIREIHAQTA